MSPPGYGEVPSQKEAKGDFSTRLTMLAPDAPVYENESLSPARRKLFVLTGRPKGANGSLSFY